MRAFKGDDMAIGGDYQVFQAGDVLLQSGVVFPSLRLAYKTYGTLNARKDNVIVYPTSFSAQHYDTEWLVRTHPTGAVLRDGW
jgi:homoserine O-acetyltransferase/O-succinyltransferase